MCCVLSWCIVESMSAVRSRCHYMYVSARVALREETGSRITIEASGEEVRWKLHCACVGPSSYLPKALCYITSASSESGIRMC
jgi:hypothetical protein